VSALLRGVIARLTFRRNGRAKDAPERVDVASRVPKTKEECEHYARYVWAAAQVHGEVLDVACGTGYGSRLLARSARVSGVDRDREAVDKARSRIAGTFLVAEVPPIPFASEAFDFVVSFETIEHIPDDVAFIRELRRVLRPGGTLLISTPNGDISAPTGVPLNRWHVREYTLASLTTLLGEAGLQVCDVYAQSFPPRVSRGHRITWRLHGLTWTQPARLRLATRSLFGDAEVRPRTDHQAAPGYWVVRAKERGRQ
jgi:2-polyprenyl-3-methyl-5-hydroxy-6-metoxy-1,4-benzoquinol methylase